MENSVKFMNNNSQNFIGGFTLIELLLTITIVLILGGMTSPFLARFLTQNNVSNVNEQMSGQIRKAQIYSMMSKKNGSWGVTVNNGKIVLFQGSTFNSRDSALDEIFNLSPNIIISGLTEIVFKKVTGLPNTTQTITISGNGQTKTIIVNSQGIVDSQ